AAADRRYLDGVDRDVFDGAVVASRLGDGDLVHDGAAVRVRYLAEDLVFAVERRGRHHRDKELRAVRARAGVGHREQIWAIEDQLGMELVAELIAGTTVTLPEGVTPLDHEVRDDPVEDRAVVERLARLLSGGGVGPLA